MAPKALARFVVNSRVDRFGRHLFPLAAMLMACAEPHAPQAPQARVTLDVARDPARPPPTTDASLLKFEISETPFEQGSRRAQGFLRLTVRNVSDEWLTLQRRLIVDHESALGANVWLEIHRVSDGSVPDRICRATACGARPPREYITLAPGDEFSSVKALGCYPGLPDQGPFRIVAHYRDKTAGPAGPHDSETKWFAGTLDSNAIEISVAPPEVLMDGPP